MQSNQKTQKKLDSRIPNPNRGFFSTSCSSFIKPILLASLSLILSLSCWEVSKAISTKDLLDSLKTRSSCQSAGEESRPSCGNLSSLTERHHCWLEMAHPISSSTISQVGGARLRTALNLVSNDSQTVLMAITKRNKEVSSATTSSSLMIKSTKTMTIDELNMIPDDLPMEELVAAAVLSGLEFESNRITSSVVEGLYKVPHDLGLTAYFQAAGLRFRTETPFSERLVDFPAEKQAQLMSHPEFPFARDGTIDFLEVFYTMTDQQISFVEAMWGETGRDDVLRSLRNRMPVILMGDFFIGRNIGRRSAEKELKYMALTTMLTEVFETMSGGVPGRIVTLDLGFSSNPADFHRQKDRMSQAIRALGNHTDVEILTFNNMMNLSIDLRLAADDMLNKLSKAFGSEAIARIMNWSERKETPSFVREEKVLSIKENLLRCRIGGNTMADIDRLCGDGKDEETEMIWAEEDDLRDDLIKDHIASECLGQVCNRKWTYSISETFRPKEALDSLRSKQEERCRGITAKPRKAVCAIPCFDVEVGVAKTSLVDVRTRCGLDVDKWCKADYIISKQTDREYAKAICQIILRESGIHDDEFFSVPFSGTTYSAETKLAMTMCNGIWKSKRKLKTVLSLLPVNTFEPGYKIEDIVYAVDCDEKMSVKNMREVIRSQFTGLGKKAVGRYKRLFKYDKSKLSFKELASLGIDANKYERMNGSKASDRTSSYIPISMENNVIDEIAAKMLIIDQKLKASGDLDKSSQSIMENLSKELDPPEGKYEKTHFDKWLKSTSDFMATTAGRCSNFLNRLASEIALNIDRPREQGEFNASPLGDGIWVFVFGKAVDPKGAHNYVSYMIVADGSRKKLCMDDSLFCNNVFHHSEENSGTKRHMIHSSVLLMPVFAMETYISLPNLIKNGSLIYRSRTFDSVKTGEESEVINSFARSGQYDNIPEILFLLLCRVNLNTGLWISLSRYIDMHAKASNSKLMTFIEDKLDIPCRNQQDMYILKRMMIHAKSVIDRKIGIHGGAVFTEATARMGAEDNVCVKSPSMWFSSFKSIPNFLNDTILNLSGPSPSITAMLSESNSTPVEGTLTMNIFEFYWVNAFSESVSNDHFDGVTIVDASMKIERKVMDYKYTGTTSERNFNALRNMWIVEGRPRPESFSPGLVATFNSHFLAKNLAAHELTVEDCFKGLIIGEDLNYHYDLNDIRDFNHCDTGLSPDGQMSSVLSQISRIIEERKASPLGLFSAPCVAAGKRSFFKSMKSLHGESVMETFVKSNPFRRRKISELATFKASVACNHNERIPLESLGHDPERVTSYLNANLGKRTKRIVFITNMIISLASGITPDTSWVGDFDRSMVPNDEKSNQVTKIISKAREIALRHAKDPKLESFKSSLSGGIANPLKIDSAFDCMLREAFESLTPEELKRELGEDMTSEIDKLTKEEETNREAESRELNTQLLELQRLYGDEDSEYYQYVAGIVDADVEGSPELPTGLTQSQKSKVERLVKDGYNLGQFYDEQVRKIKESSLSSTFKRERIQELKIEKAAAKEFCDQNHKMRKDASLNGTVNRTRAMVRLIEELYENIRTVSSADSLEDESVKYAKRIALLSIVVERNLRESKVLSKVLGNQRGKQPDGRVKAPHGIDAAKLAELAEVSDDCLNLHTVGSALIELATVYEQIQFFKKPQFTGVRTISILHHIGSVLQADRESIGRQEDVLDPSSTLSDESKFEHMSQAISRLNETAAREQKLGRLVLVRELSFDGEKWCGLCGPPTIIAQRAPLRSTDEAGVRYMTANQLRMYDKRVELPSSVISSWLNVKTGSSRKSADPDVMQRERGKNFFHSKNLVRITSRPIIRISTGMLEGIDHYGSTGLQRAAKFLRAEVSLKVIEKLKSMDARARGMRIEREDLYGSDDAFVGRMVSIVSMKDVLSGISKKISERRGLERAVASASRVITEEHESEELRELSGVSEEELVGLTKLIEAANETSSRERAIAEAMMSFESSDPAAEETQIAENITEDTSRDDKNFLRDALKKTHKVRSSMNLLFLPLTDKEFIAFVDELLANVEDACFRLCSIRPSGKSFYGALIREYNSIFSSKEGQTTALIKYVVASSKLFSAKSPSEAVEEIHGKLSQLCENTISTSMFHMIQYDAELLFNRLYSCSPGCKNHWKSLMPNVMDPSSLFYAAMKFPRLRRQESETIGLMFQLRRSFATDEGRALPENDMFRKMVDEQDVGAESDLASDILIHRPKLALRKSAGYKKFCGWFVEGGLPKEILTECMCVRPYIGLTPNYTILDHLYKVVEIVYSAGAAKSFKTGTAGSDLRMAAMSVSGRVFENPSKFGGPPVTLKEWFSARMDMTKQKSIVMSKKEMDVVLPDKPTFEALVRLRRWVGLNSCNMEIREKRLANPRYGKQRKRSEQPVGEIPTVKFLLKNWGGLESEFKFSNSAENRTLNVMKKTVPEMSKSFDEFLGSTGHTNYFSNGNLLGRSPDDIRENIKDLIAKRNLIHVLSQKIRYRSAHVKAFARHGRCTTLDQFLKNSLQTTENMFKHVNLRVTTDYGHETLFDSSFSDSGKVEDALVLLWNLLVVYPSILDGSSSEQLANCVMNGNDTLWNMMKDISYPDDLSSYRHLPAQLKSLLLTVSSSVATDEAGRDAVKLAFSYLTSDFSKHGFIVVLECSSLRSSQNQNMFSCVSLHDDGFVKLSVLGLTGHRKASIAVSQSMSRMNMCNGVRAVLSYYLNAPETSNTEALIKSFEHLKIELSDEGTNGELRVDGRSIYRSSELSDRLSEQIRNKVPCMLVEHEPIEMVASLNFSDVKMDRIDYEVRLTAKVSWPQGLEFITSSGPTPTHFVDTHRAVLRRFDMSVIPRTCEASVHPQTALKCALGPVKFNEFKKSLEMVAKSLDHVDNSTLPTELVGLMKNDLNLSWQGIFFRNLLSAEAGMKYIADSSRIISPSQIMRALPSCSNFKRVNFLALLNTSIQNVGRPRTSRFNDPIEEEIVRFQEEGTADQMARVMRESAETLDAFQTFLSGNTQAFEDRAQNFPVLLGVAKTSDSEKEGYIEVTEPVSGSSFWLSLNGTMFQPDEMESSFLTKSYTLLKKGVRYVALKIGDIVGQSVDMNPQISSLETVNVGSEMSKCISEKCSKDESGLIAAQIVLWTISFAGGLSKINPGYSTLRCCGTILSACIEDDGDNLIAGWVAKITSLKGTREWSDVGLPALTEIRRLGILTKMSDFDFTISRCIWAVIFKDHIVLDPQTRWSSVDSYKDSYVNSIVDHCLLDRGIISSVRSGFIPKKTQIAALVNDCLQSVYNKDEKKSAADPLDRTAIFLLAKLRLACSEEHMKPLNLRITCLIDCLITFGRKIGDIRDPFIKGLTMMVSSQKQENSSYETSTRKVLEDFNHPCLNALECLDSSRVPSTDAIEVLEDISRLLESHRTALEAICTTGSRRQSLVTRQNFNEAVDLLRNTFGDAGGRNSAVINYFMGDQSTHSAKITIKAVISCVFMYCVDTLAPVSDQISSLLMSSALRSKGWQNDRMKSLAKSSWVEYTFGTGQLIRDFVNMDQQTTMSDFMMKRILVIPSSMAVARECIMTDKLSNVCAQLQTSMDEGRCVVMSSPLLRTELSEALGLYKISECGEESIGKNVKNRYAGSRHRVSTYSICDRSNKRIRVESPVHEKSISFDIIGSASGIDAFISSFPHMRTRSISAILPRLVDVAIKENCCRNILSHVSQGARLLDNINHSLMSRRKASDVLECVSTMKAKAIRERVEAIGFRPSVSSGSFLPTLYGEEKTISEIPMETQLVKNISKIVKEFGIPENEEMSTEWAERELRMISWFRTASENRPDLLKNRELVLQVNARIITMALSVPEELIAGIQNMDMDPNKILIIDPKGLSRSSELEKCFLIHKLLEVTRTRVLRTQVQKKIRESLKHRMTSSSELFKLYEETCKAELIQTDVDVRTAFTSLTRESMISLATVMQERGRSSEIKSDEDINMNRVQNYLREKVTEWGEDHLSHLSRVHVQVCLALIPDETTKLEKFILLDHVLGELISQTSVDDSNVPTVFNSSLGFTSELRERAKKVDVDHKTFLEMSLGLKYPKMITMMNSTITDELVPKDLLENVSAICDRNPLMTLRLTKKNLTNVIRGIKTAATEMRIASSASASVDLDDLESDDEDVGEQGVNGSNRVRDLVRSKFGEDQSKRITKMYISCVGKATLSDIGDANVSKLYAKICELASRMAVSPAVFMQPAELRTDGEQTSLAPIAESREDRDVPQSRPQTPLGRTERTSSAAERVVPDTPGRLSDSMPDLEEVSNDGSRHGEVVGSEANEAAQLAAASDVASEISASQTSSVAQDVVSSGNVNPRRTLWADISDDE